MSGCDENLYPVFKNAMEIARKCGLEPGEITSVKVNGRLSRALGRCTRRYSGGVYYQIELSKEMIQKCDKRFITEVLLHEIVHTCEGCMNHGANFKRNAAKIMAKYPQYNIKRQNSPKAECNAMMRYEAREPKYILRCTKCGQEIKRFKMSKAVRHYQLYICGKCGGQLIRVK